MLLKCLQRIWSYHLKKTEILGQDISGIPNIWIDDHKLQVVEEFTYLGSTVIDEPVCKGYNRGKLNKTIVRETTEKKVQHNKHHQSMCAQIGLFSRSRRCSKYDHTLVYPLSSLTDGAEDGV